MEKSLTQEQLKQTSDISEADKELIEATVGDTGMDHDGDADSSLAKAMRAFLARLFLEVVPDEILREDIKMRAACFVEGWEYANEARDKQGGSE